VSFWSHEITLAFDDHTLTLTLREWVNDAAMTVFFFVAGLEIKRELTLGELRDPRQAALPIIGAFGGMVVPAAIFAILNAGGEGSDGWGIPMATDIAIVMGVVALIGSRAPSWLKLFLLALAIVDDMGAILVIAIFYSEGVSFGWLLFALAMLGVAALIRRRIPVIGVYVALGALCWFGLHEAHVHPTLAGVAFGLLAPVVPRRQNKLELDPHLHDDDDPRAAAALSGQVRAGVSIVEWLSFRLHPFTAFLIVPVFALANAGVRIPGSEIGEALSSTVTWGVILGLVVGKTVGISAAVFLAVLAGIGRLPPGVRPVTVLGGAALGGIGFTVSLFVTELAFGDTAPGRDARLGVLIASLIAAAVGTTIVLLGHRREAAPSEATAPTVAPVVTPPGS
jgi:NhaA family Na+:H+ antiporter